MMVILEGFIEGFWDFIWTLELVFHSPLQRWESSWSQMLLQIFSISCHQAFKSKILGHMNQFHLDSGVKLDGIDRRTRSESINQIERVKLNRMLFQPSQPRGQRCGNSAAFPNNCPTLPFSMIRFKAHNYRPFHGWLFVTDAYSNEVLIPCCSTSFDCGLSRKYYSRRN